MRKKILLAIAVFTAGLCSIIYELLISTAATYFLGNGVKQFSLIIGVYLCSMGVGAFISKFFKKRSLLFFIHIEYLLGFIGGISVPLIYFLFVNVSPTALQFYCLFIIFIIGLLTGMEVPLLTFVSSEKEVKDDLSNILSLDYIGGLLATLIFPFILLPFLGLFYSSLLFGIVNIILGLLLSLRFFKERKKQLIPGFIALISLLILVVSAGSLLKIWDEKIYKSPIVLNVQTPYQKIVLTKTPNNDIRLYLNRIIQFSSKDEHRYHESLVHTPLVYHKSPRRVLILGGGENLASREALKDDRIEYIDVVDIDGEMFKLAKENILLKQINKNAALHQKVNLITEDAFTFLNSNRDLYDLIIADLPDPSNESIARLYSKQFFLMVKRNMKVDGIFVTQSGEIYFSNTVFSCINTTMNEVFDKVTPYHVYIPSFGDWGFNMAFRSSTNIKQLRSLPENLKYLNQTQLENLFEWPTDVILKETLVNTLDNPVILNYYLEDWNRWKKDFETSAP
ncbi:polyamine aminopropyltransferase [Ascidiimonas sp. W6]|uniref:polyamine aminopropyltransferase n=1 Tax=Ascidiimonas meishanensis TaxID=3128903 RepID=UPI0030ECC672